MSRKKKIIKKKLLKNFILLLTIVWISIAIVLYLTKDNSKDSLNKIGYNYLQIEQINKNVSNKNKKYIIKLGYMENLTEFILDKNYKDENLEEYIKYYKKYKINPDKIIIWVNNYKDIDIEFNEVNLSLLQEKYFIFDNLQRYINYYNNNKNKSFTEIIKRVNSNIDKNFYVDIKKADTSKEKLIIVNKIYFLDKVHEPTNLVNVETKYGRTSVKLQKEAYESFKKMADSAKKENLTLYIRSGYRSYNDQQNMYNYYVKNDGIKEADTYSARPGHSEHQTGLAVDLIKGSTGSYDEFKNTKEFEWMKQNAYKYGFILRYTKDNEYITGYKYEPWHYRYVGVEVAEKIQNLKITYEEYYAYYVE